MNQGSTMSHVVNGKTFHILGWKVLFQHFQWYEKLDDGLHKHPAAISGGMVLTQSVSEDILQVGDFQF